MKLHVRHITDYRYTEPLRYALPLFREVHEARARENLVRGLARVSG